MGHSYNYFRLTITDMRRDASMEAAVFASLGDLILYDADGEILSLTDGATYSASSSLADYPPKNAFGLDPSVFWHSDYVNEVTTTNWIQIQLPTAAEVAKIGIIPASWNYLDAPVDFIFSASEDGVAWSTLYYARNLTVGWSGGVERQFEIDYSLLVKTYYAREYKATYGGTLPDPDEVCGAYNHCKTHGSNNYIYRSFLWHDLSGIPYKSRILSAKLYVYCYYHNDNAAGALHNFSRVTESWDEVTLTWNNMPAVDSRLYCDEWQTAPALNSWGSWDITPLVQEWVDQTYPNYGLQIVNQSENVYRKDWFFANRRSSYGGTYIEIEYEPEEEYRITRPRMEEIVTEIRTLSGSEDTMKPSAMVTHLATANSNVTTEAELIAQIASALEGKSGNVAVAHTPGYIYTVQQDEIVTLTKEATCYPLATISQYGDYFEVIDGSIVCKKACVAEVYGQIYMRDSFAINDSVTTQVRLSSLADPVILQINRIAANTDPYEQVAGGPVMVNIAVGDTLTFWARNATYARGNLYNYYTHSFVYIKVVN